MLVKGDVEVEVVDKRPALHDVYDVAELVGVPYGVDAAFCEVHAGQEPCEQDGRETPHFGGHRRGVPSVAHAFGEFRRFSGSDLAIFGLGQLAPYGDRVGAGNRALSVFWVAFVNAGELDPSLSDMLPITIVLKVPTSVGVSNRQDFVRTK